MLAQLPSALEAFDDAGSVFLPPDPNYQDHGDDDDSFASQDTLLEDARTKHTRGWQGSASRPRRGTRSP